MKTQKRQYVLTHQAEIQKNREALEATYDLKDGFKTFTSEQAQKSALPKDCYYDGTKGGVSAVAAKETYLIDILFSDIEDLDNADTILLAGSKTTFMEVAKTYMLRWWDPSINPKDAATFGIGEHKEKERSDE